MNRGLPLLFIACCVLSACASSPGIPDTNYFRLPSRQPLPIAVAPWLSTPVEIDTFLADGVHADQALLYSTDPDGERLRAYHYQLWVDPPTRLLQGRLIKALSEANVAPLVSERLPAAADHWRVQGRIEAFERVLREQGWQAVVALQFRVEHGANELPVLLKEYRQECEVGSDGVREAVRALGRCVDLAFADFTSDLHKAAVTQGSVEGVNSDARHPGVRRDPS